ncbi:MAG: DUF2789 family protein [Betaproteobacteria bacterium]
MEPPVHRFGDLFRQLGLADRPTEIAAFLARHRPLPAKTALADAPIWSPAQSRFLREGIADNADWAQLVGQLDASLRDFASDRQRPHERTAPPQV